MSSDLIPLAMQGSNKKYKIPCGTKHHEHLAVLKTPGSAGG